MKVGFEWKTKSDNMEVRKVMEKITWAMLLKSWDDSQATKFGEPSQKHSRTNQSTHHQHSNKPNL